MNIDPSMTQASRETLTRLRIHGLSENLSVEQVTDLALIATQILRDDASPKRASATVQALLDIIETSTEKNSQSEQIACAAGCNYCCHQFVSATPPEIFYFADRIRRGAGFEAQRSAISEAAANVRSRDPDTVERTMARCALLVDEGCGAYDGRPISCRGYNSEDVNLCRSWLSNRAVEIPINRIQINIGNQGKIALWAALKACGHADTTFELMSALDVALAAEDAEERWLNGEEIFAEVYVDQSRGADVAPILKQITDGVVRGLS